MKRLFFHAQQAGRNVLRRNILLREKSFLRISQTQVLERSRIKQKNGVVLIYFAVIVFGIFAILSMIIDIGLARITQAQMQTAVDGGSLLGLQNQDNALLTEQEKRALVRDQISSVFDDDLDLSSDNGSLGAGPVVPLIGPPDELKTSLNALQTIDAANLGVYDPVLQLNDEDNMLHGDMVRGEYFPAGAHFENSDYTRDDFDHESADPNAFLVRMRRANGNSDNDDGVSSSAPPLPYLFGLATTMQVDSVGTGPRFEGITVRATAISSTSVVKGVGVVSDEEEENTLGAVPFALQKEFWTNDEKFPFNAAISVSVDNGNISTDEIIGTMIAADQPMFVGDKIESQSIMASDFDGYVPVVAEIDENSLIVGFGRSGMSVDEDNNVSITKFESQIAYENATALLIQGLGDTQVLGQLLTEEDEALLAPVIAR